MHEAIIELFRNRPILAAELLAEVFSVVLPRFTEARIESADLSNVVPEELRADLLVLLLDGEPVLVIIVEAQLHFDREKTFTWPSYVIGAHARFRCHASLLVVCPDEALAARLARPIVFGPGDSKLTPFVLGPQGIPMVTEVAQAQARPELAVLSAMAHGKTDAGLDVVMAAFQASAGVEGDKRKALYADLVLNSAGEAARRALEALMMKNYEYQSDFARKYFAEGRTEGRLEGLKPLFERRLGRALTTAEKARLSARVQEQGPEHIGNLVLDLTSEALAAWLAATNGH
jgi:hypothetical protein